nr:BrxA/BrxB family bacilliredoxin [Bacilli bacterium]
MAYDSPEYAEIIAPMREELTSIGFKELHSASEVEQAIANAKGNTLFVVNSICGCAARIARPAVREALEKYPQQIEHLYTVFAGLDIEATEKARDLFTSFAPSSPSIALFQDGEFKTLIERKQIERHTIPEVKETLVQAITEHFVS